MPPAASGTTPPGNAVQPQVYITDSNSWEQHSASIGGAGAAGAAFGAGAISSSAGGARPQTAEVIKTFGGRCPQATVNNRFNVSDYVVELDHEGGKGLLSHKDKIAVFVQTSGDSIFSTSTRSVGGSVQDACTAILAHWNAHSAELKAAAIAQATAPPPAAAPIVVQTAAGMTPGVTFQASIADCDIEVDGEFMGSTPSTLNLAPGKHAVVVKKAGYQDWTRSMTVANGTIRVNAEMVAK